MNYTGRIKQLRKEKGLTQSQISMVLGIHAVQYLRYEKGQNEMKMYHLITLAKFYKVSTDYLLGLTDDPKGSWLK